MQKNAIYIGVLCSAAYLAVYIARNMLSAVTPELLEEIRLTRVPPREIDFRMS